jgi:hypothetical protein
MENKNEKPTIPQQVAGKVILPMTMSQYQRQLKELKLKLSKQAVTNSILELDNGQLSLTMRRGLKVGHISGKTTIEYPQEDQLKVNINPQIPSQLSQIPRLLKVFEREAYNTQDITTVNNAVGSKSVEAKLRDMVSDPILGSPDLVSQLKVSQLGTFKTTNSKPLGK